MVDKALSVVTTIFAVTALGIALRPNAPTAKVITATFSGIAKTQRAAFGPS